ncbi:MAG: hypothetical protein RJB39_791 [Candidatus Parcubacteria bacterium]
MYTYTSMFVVAQKITEGLKIAAVAVIFIAVPHIVQAANLSFSQTKDSYNIGDTFSVSVNVDSGSQSVNAVSGTVSFPKDKLSVVSVSKSGSVVSLWVQDPSSSNAAGTVSFEGVILNPGFTGSRGKIITINFKAKDQGAVNLSFSSGSVLANDGSGSNILESLKTSSLVIQSKSTTDPEPETVLVDEVTDDSRAQGPAITSATHPDQSKWYSNNTPEFVWTLPLGALEVRTSIGKSSNSIPTVRYIPPISRKKLDPLPDGVYYFNLQVRTSAGWGSISRYKVNIDTQPPESFAITFPHGKDSLEPQPVILFNTTDTGSKVQYYDIKIGNGGPARAAPLALSNPYPLPLQDPGTHIVTVTAVDGAGNTTSTSTEFMIEGIEPPIIAYYPEEINAGDVLKIRGTTYPNADVYIIIKEQDKVVSEEYTRSNRLGDFEIIASKRLEKGTYTFTARVTDDRGAKSVETVPLQIEVKSRFLVDITASTLNLLSVFILGLLAVAGVVCLTMFVWHRCHRVLRHIRSAGGEVAELTETSFGLLKKDVQDHLSILRDIKRKKPSIKDEIIFLQDFEEDLAKAEEIIERKIQADLKKKGL